MKTVATPWFKVSRFMLFGFGIPLTVIGLIIYITYDKNWAILSNGLLWLILGIALWIIGTNEKRSLERVKRNGQCYNSAVISILPSSWIKIGSYVTAKVDCVLYSEQGERIIRSGYHLLYPMDRLENLYAKIYVDNENGMEKCLIEVFRY